MIIPRRHQGRVFHVDGTRLVEVDKPDPSRTVIRIEGRGSADDVREALATIKWHQITTKPNLS